MWIEHLLKGGGRKKIFQFCTNYTGSQNLYLRAIQGHSGETTVDPSLLDNVLIPDNVFELTRSRRNSTIRNSTCRGSVRRRRSSQSRNTDCYLTRTRTLFRDDIHLAHHYQCEAGGEGNESQEVRRSRSDMNDSCSGRGSRVSSAELARALIRVLENKAFFKRYQVQTRR